MPLCLNCVVLELQHLIKVINSAVYREQLRICMEYFLQRVRKRKGSDFVLWANEYHLLLNFAVRGEADVINFLLCTYQQTTDHEV